jgi:FkbM family methyltransferase
MDHQRPPLTRSREPKRLLFFGATLLIPAAFLAFYTLGAREHTLLVLRHYFSGRAAHCSLADSLASPLATRKQATRSEELAKSAAVIQSDPAGFRLWKTADGNFWMPAGSNGVLHYDLAEQDRGIYGSGSRGIHPGDTVLDCGANVGVYARKALRDGAKLVVAIEPAPENIEALKRNLAAEIADGRVIIDPKGVWDKDDVLRFEINPVNSAADSFVRVNQQVKGNLVSVPVTTIDHLVAELRLPRVDFIKMDIEGSERQAVAGARETIRRHHPRMALCVYHLPDDPDVIPSLVTAISPEYRMTTGCMCALNRITPEVALFY